MSFRLFSRMLRPSSRADTQAAAKPSPAHKGHWPRASTHIHLVTKTFAFILSFNYVSEVKSHFSYLLTYLLTYLLAYLLTYFVALLFWASCLRTLQALPRAQPKASKLLAAAAVVGMRRPSPETSRGHRGSWRSSDTSCLKSVKSTIK